MKHVKSERLKRLETELNDLEQWLKLGLVPKKDVDKHKEEIDVVKKKISDEKERLQFLRESGEGEEALMAKRPAAARPAGYNEMPTAPDLDAAENTHETEGEFEVTATAHTIDEREEEEEEREEEEEDLEEDESYFSDKNRWRRGGIVDPDADDW